MICLQQINRNNTLYKLGRSHLIREIIKQKYLILMILPPVIFTFIFSYIPMYGILISFKDYNPAKGVWASEWVGFKYFKFFFENPYCIRLVKNTLLLGLYSLFWGFPAPIILALLMNEIKNKHFKKITQTISYLPHFVSVVIIVGILKTMADNTGLFNIIAHALGSPEPIMFFGESSWFRTLYIGSDIWQEIGWGTIIYLAALSGIDTSLYEAADIDGCNRFKKALHITIPSILPTVTILLILSTGGIISVGFEKVMLMYNPMTYDVSDVISTYVYREGIQNSRFSYTTAVGLMQNVVSFVMVFISNMLSKKLSNNSLW